MSGLTIRSCICSFIKASAEIRKDPEAFQKGCLFIWASFQLLAHAQKNPKAFHRAAILNSAQSLDFFGFLRLPAKLPFLQRKKRGASHLPPPSRLAWWSERVFDLVDLGALPCFLGEWQLLDLAKWGQKIASLRIGSFFIRYTLDQWVRGIMCFGFFLQSLEGITILYKERDLSALNLLLLGTFECAYNLSILAASSSLTIVSLCWIAKGVGLFAFFRTLHATAE